ncbi:hypothetical protein BJ742DRAFT_834122 [Cladochytrium replicatum]|nr:hypothetical protein BJ742DRAFT_834122 [Cladochytrium replicatum]
MLQSSSKDLLSSSSQSTHHAQENSSSASLAYSPPRDNEYRPQGVVLLKDGYHNTKNEYFYPPIPPPPQGFTPPDNRPLWKRRKWLVIASAIGVVLVLAAIIVPTSLFVSLNNRINSPQNSATTSNVPTRSSTPSTLSPTPAPSATTYPITLSNGSTLLDPIIRPSNNPSLTFNLSTIQKSVAVFNDNGYEYRVAFARSLSTIERSAPNPPIKTNYCEGLNVVMCHLEVQGVATNPYAYPGGSLTSLEWSAVTVDTIQGLRMSFGPALSIYCRRTVSIFVLCSASTVAAPTFNKNNVTVNQIAGTCNYDISFFHASGCPV